MKAAQSIAYIFWFFFIICSVYPENIPCKKKKESWFFQKYVCVCTSTYCDNIETPTELTSGQYYHYSTAKATPGFTLSEGTFDSIDNSRSQHLQSSTDYYITVDSSKTYQTFSGVGGGFSDSSAYNYNLLSTAAQEYLIESFYGKTGIELTYGRVPIGPTDFSLEYYSYDDTVDDMDMKYFNLTEFELNTKMPFIQAAINASNRGVRLLATPWTAPSWMKDNNNTKPGFMIPKYHEAFSNYIAKFFEQYKENGVEYWGLSEMNEPIFGVEIDFKMPNVMMMPNQMRAWTKDYLVPILADAGFGDLKILVLDDERPFLQWYADRLLSDNETAALIDGFAMHWYADSDSNTDILDDFNTKYPDKFLLYTEASTSGGWFLNNVEFGGISLGSWDIADKYIANIIQNYQHWSVGYMCWNLCLNLKGGPYMQMSQEAPIIIDSSKGEFYKQPLYYALGHFSKFIYPNSTRIGLTVKQNANSQNPQFGPSSSSFDGIATTNPDESTTVILYNPSSDTKTVVLIDTQKGNITTTVEAHSINTFMYW